MLLGCQGGRTDEEIVESFGGVAHDPVYCTICHGVSDVAVMRVMQRRC